ncbi:PucR family transcriptional regulator [Arthrobacter mobilis]|uniref:PucR family transcriptional regulator n=1 Tax=Arthrobacter mobilis TaxID=2724944 RepID=A0A7X6QME7_9MICC|nr:PucR family transcriptional regulator [Arthrobacter mobilis]NKX56686.1 PucR family transcriptional regulator [Arthrobacter mobilis]
MAIALTEVLESELLQRAEPRVRAGSGRVPSAMVRWVHSSEVLQIAPLLHGEELLLTGGEALLGLKPAAQQDYVRRLAERHVAALAVESAGLARPLSEELIAAAEASGLPLIELRRVVPFVDVAEQINRRIVTQQAAAYQAADSLSQRLAERLAAHGPDIQPLLELIERTLDVDASLMDPNGTMIGSAGGAPPEGAPRVETDILVSGSVLAKLVMQPHSGAPKDFLAMVGERVASILALAVSQRHAPTLEQVADTEFMRAVVQGANRAKLLELSEAAGVPAAEPVLMMAFRRTGSAQLHGVLEQALRRCCPGARTYLADEEWCALVPLGTSATRRRRAAILENLQRQLSAVAVAGVVGPTVQDPGDAHWSLREARLSYALGPAAKAGNNVWDSENFVVERLAARELSPAAAEHLVQELVGEVMAYDRQRGTQLLVTLDRWLAFGCNTTETARSLFLERQSLHNRLSKIFELLGGDPRGSGKMAGLHLAARIAVHPRTPAVID